MKDNEASEAGEGFKTGRPICERQDETVPDSPHGIEAGRPPVLSVPQWVIDYHNANYQSSAGKAVKILFDLVNAQDQTIADLKAEVEQLKAEATKPLTDEERRELETLRGYQMDPKRFMPQVAQDRLHQLNRKDWGLAPQELAALRERNAKLVEALSELVHLHLCEQEGLQSGRPTPSQWLAAVDKASGILNPETK